MEMGGAGRGTTRGTEERIGSSRTEIEDIRTIEITTLTRMDITNRATDIMDRGTWRTMPLEQETPA